MKLEHGVLTGITRLTSAHPIYAFFNDQQVGVGGSGDFRCDAFELLFWGSGRSGFRDFPALLLLACAHCA
jgi:hypothetical protein